MKPFSWELNTVFLCVVRIMSYTSDLPQLKVDQIVAKALRMWSKQIPLKFRRVRWGTADIMIDFAKGGKNGSCRLILCLFT